MRVIGSVEVGGVEYRAVWASMSWITDDPCGGNTLALAVRGEEQKNEAIVRRNAKLAEVEDTLRQLREVGLKDAKLCQLFNWKGKIDGLAQHVKVLVASLK